MIGVAGKIGVSALTRPKFSWALTQELVGAKTGKIGTKSSKVATERIAKFRFKGILKSPCGDFTSLAYLNRLVKA
jgi:hypothetical protein